MKKLLFLVLILCAGYSYAVQPEFRVPVSVNNIADPGLNSAGVDVCKLVTSTTPALVTDSEGTTITDGFLHYVVVPTTGAVTVFLSIRSTDTANITGPRLVPRLGTVNGGANGGLSSQVITFSPPVPFNNDGLSVNLEPAGSAPATGVEFGVGVRWKRQ